MVNTTGGIRGFLGRRSGCPCGEEWKLPPAFYAK